MIVNVRVPAVTFVPVELNITSCSAWRKKESNALSLESDVSVNVPVAALKVPMMPKLSVNDSLSCPLALF